MPIRNEFVGQYNYIQIKSGNAWKTILASSVSKPRTMEAKANFNLLQGTNEPRIMDISEINETFTISSPILIGSASAIDGRKLISNEIENVLYRHGSILPVLTNANVNIRENEATVSMTLMSDGSPEAGQNFNINASTNPPSELNPLLPGNVPSRTAKWYDFRVRFGPFVFYIYEASLTFTTQTEKRNFVGAYLPNNSAPINSTYNLGTQYPWIAVRGLSLTGSGKAAVLLSDADCKGDMIDGIERFFRNASSEPPTKDSDLLTNNYAVNWNPPWNDTYSGDIADVTLQCPGFTRTTANSIIFEVYNSGSNSCTSGDYGTWEPLFMSESNNPLFDFSKGIINKSTLDINSSLITVDFDFISYIVKPEDEYCAKTS